MGRRILATRYQETATTVRRLRDDLSRCANFSRVENTVSPTELVDTAETACRVRLSILERVYCGEYHTDSHEVGRISERIRSRDELIWFWGSRAAVARLRACLRAGTDLPDDVELGTVTVLCAEEEFGSGHAELCRSGSTDRTLGAVGPILSRTIAYMSGEEPHLSPRFHTLVLEPRNCRSAAGIKGGVAIHRIHSRYVRSRFWGYAPWYIMQRQRIEYLDLRESNRSPDDVLAGLKACGPWYFYDDEEAAFAAALCTLNFGMKPPIRTSRTHSQDMSARFEVKTAGDSALVPMNHGTAVPARSRQGLSLPAAVARLSESQVCCSVVRLPLETEATLGDQAWLQSNGFRLTSILPPKRTWIERAGGRLSLQCPAFGLWSRPDSRYEIEPPFYLNSPTTDAAEATILRYLRMRLLAC